MNCELKIMNYELKIMNCELIVVTLSQNIYIKRK